MSELAVVPEGNNAWLYWWACMRDMKRLRIIRELRLEFNGRWGDPVVLCQEDDGAHLPQELREKLNVLYLRMFTA